VFIRNNVATGALLFKVRQNTTRWRRAPKGFNILRFSRIPIFRFAYTKSPADLLVSLYSLRRFTLLYWSTTITINYHIFTI